MTRVSDTTTLLSRNASGEPANLRAESGHFSGGSGCYVDIESTASNLEEPERQGLSGSQAYVLDRCAATPKFTLASLDEAGNIFNTAFGGYEAPTVTADGDEAIFAGETAEERNFHVYLRNLGAGTTSIVDRASGASGAVADAQVQNLAISATGCRVVFSSAATNLVAGSAPGLAEELEPSEVYVRQLAPCHPAAAQPPSATPTPAPLALGPPWRDQAGGELPRPQGALVGLRRPRRGAGPDPEAAERTPSRLAAAEDADGGGGPRRGSVKVRLPALGAGRYRFKLRLLGDPDNPTLTRRLAVGGRH